MIERISMDMLGPATRGHEVRYCLAAGLLRPGDVVIDAACGIGYGCEILDARRDTTYYGVDIDLSHVAIKPSPSRCFIAADLTSWRPSFPFDVVVGFETIEHLSDYSTYVEWARNARRYIVVSVPIVPTVGINAFHLHDFEAGDMVKLFADDDTWELFQFFEQPAEVSGVYIFARRGVSPLSGTHLIGGVVESHDGTADQKRVGCWGRIFTFVVERMKSSRWSQL